MRSLLDVSVLIALLDAGHSLHARAREWFKDHASDGWASCPITQNGCVRIMSSQSYPNALPLPAVIERLSAACSSELHEFWQDDISVLAPEVFDSGRLHGPLQLTDAYLLALACHRGGRLVTFDTAVPRSAVIRARAGNLVVL
ncbi:MAG: PIN domain-containing protein [Burkholderiales bacterium]|nr:PIN domain-containing protein [Burkholderiales bacterium]